MMFPIRASQVGEFGSKFRKAREKKSLSLDDVSHVTKIGSRMLQAIEEENFDRLPGGIFTKGFIRTYAKHLELNDDEAIAAYLALLRQTQIDALDAQIDAQTNAQTGAKMGAKEIPQPERRPGKSRAAPPQKPGAIKSGKLTASTLDKTGAAKRQAPAEVEELPELQLPRAEDVRSRRRDFGNSGPEIPWRLIAVAAVVLILAAVLWTRRSPRPPTVAIAPSPASHAQTGTTAAPASANPSSTSPSPSQATNPAQRTASSPQPQLRSASASASHPPALAAVSAPSPADDKDAGNHGATVPPLQKSNLSPLDLALSQKEKSTAPLTLVIRATETSWISILADGQPVKNETLIAPASTSVRAAREVVAKVGNAAGVTFVWNGQEIPPTGAEAEVKTFIFDSNGMRVASPTPPPAQ